MLYPITQIKQAITHLIQNQSTHVSDSEVQSWKNKATWLTELSFMPSLKNAWIEMERILPGTTKSRVDVLIWAKTSQKMICLIIEDKQWQLKHMNYDEKIQCYQSKHDKQWRTHPAQQVYSYQKHWEYSELNDVMDVEYIPIVHLINVNELSEIQTFKLHHQTSSRVHWSMKYTLGQTMNKILSTFGVIEPLLTNELDLLQKEYHRSNRPIPIPNMKDHLLDYQELICRKIESFIRNHTGSNGLYIPIVMKRSWGGGKSFMAVHLYNQLKNYFKTALISGSESFAQRMNQDPHFTGLYQGAFQIQKAIHTCELIIIDEGARMMEKNMPDWDKIHYFNAFLKRGGKLIFIADEAQMIKSMDYDWEKRLLNDNQSTHVVKNITNGIITQQFRSNIDMNLFFSGIWNHSDSFPNDVKKSVTVRSCFEEAYQTYVANRNGSNNALILSTYHVPWVSEKDHNAIDFTFGHRKLQWNSKSGVHIHPDFNVGYTPKIIGTSFDHILFIWRWFVIRNGTWQLNINDECYDINLVNAFKKPMLDLKKQDLIKHSIELMLSRFVQTCVLYVEDDETYEYLTKKIM